MNRGLTFGMSLCLHDALLNSLHYDWLSCLHSVRLDESKYMVVSLSKDGFG